MNLTNDERTCDEHFFEEALKEDYKLTSGERRMKITKEDAETILAFHDGKQIQFNRSIGCGWRDTSGTPDWNFDETKYRVKPDPKEFWVNEYEGRDNWTYTDKQVAIKSASPNATRVAVHYKEVIEE